MHFSGRARGSGWLWTPHEGGVVEGQELPWPLVSLFPSPKPRGRKKAQLLQMQCLFLPTYLPLALSLWAGYGWLSSPTLP